MPETQVMPQARVILRWIARAITIGYLGFWLFYNVASLFIDRTGSGTTEVIVHLSMAVMIIVLLLLLYLFELLAAVIFICLGIAAYLQWGQYSTFVGMPMCLLFVLIGVMYLIVGWLDYQARKVTGSSQSSPPQPEQ